MPRSTAATLSLARMRQIALIGMGWTIILVGFLMVPLPGPFGLPIMLVGGVIVLRNSDESKRLFVRMKRRFPRLFVPIERVRGHLRRRRRQGS